MSTEKEEKIRVRFKNGDIRTLRPVVVDDAVMGEFEQLAGIRFKPGDDIYRRTIRTVKTWLSKHGLHSRGATELITLAEVIIAIWYAPDDEAIVAFTEEDNECLVFSIYDSENVFFRVSKMVYAEITGNFSEAFDGDELWVNAEILDGMDQAKSIKELHTQLKEAVETEDYEKAAAIRDKINSMNKS